MQSRDKQLERLGEEYAQNLERKRQKEVRMKDKKRLHEEVNQENEKLEHGIQQTDRQLVRIRLDHMNVKGELNGFRDEVEVLKNQLGACETEKSSTKNQLTVLMKSLEARKVKYQSMHRNLGNQQRALQDAEEETKNKDQT